MARHKERGRTTRARRGSDREEQWEPARGRRPSSRYSTEREYDYGEPRRGSPERWDDEWYGRERDEDDRYGYGSRPRYGADYDDRDYRGRRPERREWDERDYDRGPRDWFRAREMRPEYEPEGRRREWDERDEYEYDRARRSRGGFAAMGREERREISSRGGRAPRGESGRERARTRSTGDERPRRRWGATPRRGKSRRGFAAMDPRKQREIARKGGRASARKRS